LIFFASMERAEKERWMRRALHLARLGEAKTAPNPMVGCVIVHPEAELIGEGWHAAFGGPHAEVHAIASVKQKELLRESTVLVNLEPCAHYGKTPPCCNLLIENEVAEVIIANSDPNPLVSGRGADALRKAGIRVETGILEAEGRKLNRFFFCAQEKERPFITLKWAQTSDGFIGPEDGKPVIISSAESRLMVHALRSVHQAIMVGRNTLRNDNPLLNLRNLPGRQPIRIVSDPKLELTGNLQVFQDKGSPTWILNDSEDGLKGGIRLVKLQHADNLNEVLPRLREQGINSLLVEGGSNLLMQFLDEGLWDEAIIFTSPARMQNGIPAPDMRRFTISTSGRSGGDRIDVYSPVSG
jgi:diaminohydroxyphosphoribosylaminopyrimidine deaminase/5-amino-6-(5-phosphoribosylamino)uracil reductase